METQTCNWSVSTCILTKPVEVSDVLCYGGLYMATADGRKLKVADGLPEQTLRVQGGTFQEPS